MLIEHGAIVQEGTRWVATADVASIKIPETLHGLLLARIDQLPDDAKRSLRCGGDRPPVPGASAGARSEPSRDHDHPGGRPRGEGPHPTRVYPPGARACSGTASSRTQPTRPCSSRSVANSMGGSARRWKRCTRSARASFALVGHALRAGRRRRARDRVLRGGCQACARPVRDPGGIRGVRSGSEPDRRGGGRPGRGRALGR